MKKFLLNSFGVVPLLMMAAFFGCQPRTNPSRIGAGNETKPGQTETDQGPDEVVATLVNSEELIREINPVLAKLGRAAANLELRRDHPDNLFSQECQFRDITATGSSIQTRDARNIISVKTGDLNKPAEPTAIWSLLIDQIQYFDNVRFYAIKVADRSSLPKSFTTEVGFEALARTTNETWLAIAAHGELTWEQEKPGNWAVSCWDFDSFHISDAKQRLFDDTTAACLSPTDLSAAQRSEHWELIKSWLENGPSVFESSIQRRYFQPALSQNPSVSVVDIDNDGWDDLYVVRQWQNDLLLRNLGNGTFAEVASQFNLDQPSYDRTALFADFDNDGDQDLFLGGTLHRSQYFENENGKFIDRSAVKFPSIDLPFLVSSLSATDFNSDGLVDIYVSTYGFPPRGGAIGQWTREFLGVTERRHVLALFHGPEYDRYLNSVGPPNILLVNRGDHFEISELSPQLAGNANTLQSTWADYDNDGDPDLYIANDFASDNLFRNDGGIGFTEVTHDVGDETMTGFGMGAAWGDYDLDGRQDLYVSNMFSKAGIRIVEYFGQLDSRFRRFADGNRLYHNDNERFRLVSANAGPGLKVHKAGWSWGGQFIDIDNDGYLDIYVTSGYITAPEKYAADKDL